MLELLKKFEHARPEIVFEWKDALSEAEGWIVINSLRNGAAGGGTRMRLGLDKREVESLAKTMEVKFTVAGPSIGGAKSGINFNPADPRKKEVLERWYKAVHPILKNYYGTGGDLNVDEIHEVIPITSANGLLHPQEGVVRGYYKTEGEVFNSQIKALQKGVSLPVNDSSISPVAGKYVVADLITGYGVAQAVRHHYLLRGKDVKQKRVLIQGWGNVGAAAAWYLSGMGARITAIIDRAGGLIDKEGFTHETISRLFNEKQGNSLHSKEIIPFTEANEKVWEMGADIFIPAAASRLVSQVQLEKLLSGGLEVISCGANVPFADSEIFMGSIGAYADSHCSLIPDFIANCGMARVFAYLMQPGAKTDDRSIFDDTEKTILNALQKVYERNKGDKNIASTAFEIALSQLV